MLLDASGWSENPGLRAWRDALRQLMDTDWRGIRDRTSYSPERFTPRVYQGVMADKPRLGGATAALTYFKVPDAVNRADAYGERKQQRVVELIEPVSFTPFPTLSASRWRQSPRRKTSANS
jgi:beta-phosphoglucomutase